MITRKNLILLCTVIILFFFCRCVINTKLSPSEKILDSEIFTPAGPMIRVLVDQVSKTIPLRIESDSTINVSFPNSANNNFSAGSEITFRRKNNDLLIIYKKPDKTIDAENISEKIRLTAEKPHVKLRTQDASYTGTIELIPKNNHWYVVNELDFEDYILGVVQGEMPSSFNKNALRAQAITSRTYALYQWLLKNGEKCGTWHLNANTRSQMYVGQGSVSKETRKAVSQTCGLVIAYSGKIIQAYYSATCGGNTTRASRFFKEPDIPPLSGNKCKFCKHSPYYTWHVSYREDQVRQALETKLKIKKSRPLGKIKAIKPLLDPGDIYPSFIQITCEDGKSLRVQSQSFRSILNQLPPENKFLSPALASCKILNNELWFTGHGSGHGLGMCQYGADGMAKKGYDFLEIIQHYFPQSSLMKAWQKQASKK